MKIDGLLRSLRSPVMEELSPKVQPDQRLGTNLLARRGGKADVREAVAQVVQLKSRIRGDVPVAQRRNGVIASAQHRNVAGRASRSIEHFAALLRFTRLLERRRGRQQADESVGEHEAALIQ